MKPVESKSNSAGGIDLLTERDAGNPVLILTGPPERSLQFWEDLFREAQNNIHRLKSRPYAIQHLSTWMIEDLTEHEEQNDLSEQELGRYRKRWISLSYPDLVKEYCNYFPEGTVEGRA